MWRGAVLAVVLSSAGVAAAIEFREDPYRVGIVEVGDPVLLTYEQLTHEMDLNNEMREYVRAFGRPDYAEVQRIEMDEPFYPYEVRLYYLDGDRYIVYGRVNVAPTVNNFGSRKYIGKIDSAQLQRLLTAQPMIEPVDTVAYAPAAERGEVVVEAPPVEVAAMPEDVEIVVEPATGAGQVETAPAADVEVEMPAVVDPAVEN